MLQSRPSFRQWLQDVILVATAYAVSGWLGLLLAIPPGYATGIFPPAGIALVALLARGPGRWPGVWLGSFALNALIVPSVPSLGGALIAACIGSGAALQALVGWALVRRAVGYPASLGSPGEAARFAFAGGAVACLVSPTVGIGTLFLAGKMPATAVAINWATWWVGDALGVFVVGPIAWALIGEPRALWRQRIPTLVTSLGVTLGLVVGAFLWAAQQERLQINTEFLHESAKVENAVRNSVDQAIDTLEAVDRFVAVVGPENLDPQRFAIFATPVVHGHPGLQGVSWNRRVSLSQRNAFERRGKEWRPGFEITERNGSGVPQRAGQRPEYVAVSLIAPLEGNALALGFDIASEPIRAAAIDKALNTGKVTATAGIWLIQDEQSQYGMLLLLPHFAPSGEKKAGVDAPQPIGLTVAVLRWGTLIENALATAAPGQVAACLYDNDAPGKPLRLAGGDDCEQQIKSSVTPYQADLLLGGRHLHLQLSPTSAFLAAQNGFQAWGLLVAGIAFTGLLGILLLSMSGRQAEVEAMVSQRTGQLNSTITELAEARERREMALEGANMGVWDWNIAGDNLYLSERAWQILGTAPSSAPIGMNEAVTQRIDPEQQRYGREAMAAALKGESPFLYITLRIRHGLDQWRWGRWHGKVLEWNDQGRATRMAGTLADVTDRVESEIRLQDREQELSLITENAPAKIAHLAPGPKLIFANRLFKDYFQVDAKNQPLEEFLPTKTVEHIRAQLAASTQGGSPTAFEEALPNAMGIPHTLEITVVADSAGGAILLAKDITERKAMENDLRAARERAEEASRAKSAFLANMSHEIRTPLNAVLGMTELVLDSPIEQGQKELLQTALASGRALLALLNQLLDLAKVEAGRLEIESIPFGLRELMVDTLKPQAVEAARKNVALSWELGDDVPDGLVGDPARLRQILVNLSSNAVKFTAAGHIKIDVKTVSPSTQGATLHFRVTDTGAGIPRELQDRVFEAFTQADASTTRRYGGTGLGLTITRQLIHALGGRIELASSPGQGSTFSFTLPFGLGHTPQIAEVGTRPGAGASTGLKVLVVEDNATNLRVATAMLEHLGHHVTTAANGKLGLDTLAREDFDLVLMDMQMPVMDGIEATRQLRARELAEGRPATPVIALTANALDSDRVACKEAGMDDFLAKPVNLKDLSAALARQRTINETATAAPVIASGPPPLDTQHLDMLRETLPDDFDGFILLTIDDLRTTMAELKNALGDPDLFRRTAHKLKGLAAAVSAMPLADSAKALEKQDNPGPHHLEAVESEAQRALNALMALSPSHA